MMRSHDIHGPNIMFQHHEQQQRRGPSVSVLLNRLTSASLPSDAIAALESLLDIAKRGPTNVASGGTCSGVFDEDGRSRATPEAIEIASSSHAMTALSTLIALSYVDRDHGGGRLDMMAAAEDNQDTVPDENLNARVSNLACDLILSCLEPEPDDNSNNNNTGGGSSGSSSSSDASVSAVVRSMLGTPTDGQFINALLDRLCPNDGVSSSTPSSSTTPPSSPRIKSLAILRRLLAVSPSLVQKQLLAAPDGLARLISLLTSSLPSATNDSQQPGAVLDVRAVPDSLRNGAIRLLADLARNSSNCAKIIIFSEGYDHGLRIAAGPPSLGGEGGIVGNCSVVSDCLELCVQLTKSVDNMGAKVILGSRLLLDRIGALLDLRMGKRFLMISKGATNNVGGGGTSRPRKGNDGTGDVKRRDHGQRGDDDDGEDDEDLGRTADTGTARENPGGDAVPWLSDAEDSVIGQVLTLLSAIAGDDEDGRHSYDLQSNKNGQEDGGNSATKPSSSSRKQALISHEVICRFLLDLALFAHPPPGAPYPHGAPSLSLQCRALGFVALLARGAGEESLDTLLGRQSFFLRGVPVMERVVYLICTGGGIVGSPFYRTEGKTVNTQLSFANLLSVHALSVLRATLTSDSASLMISHALAPPTTKPESNGNIPAPTAEVTKLVNTLAESLHVLGQFNDVSENEEQGILQGRTLICSIGAASALAVFLSVPSGKDATTAREMMLGVPVPYVGSDAGVNGTSSSSEESRGVQVPKGSLLECILGYLEAVSDTDNKAEPNRWRHHPPLICVLLRLLLDWAGWSSRDITENDFFMKAFLEQPSSVALASYLNSPSSTMASESPKALVALLFGLALKTFPPRADIGGWTGDSVMNLLTGKKHSAGSFTKLVEGMKSQLSEFETDTTKLISGPWVLCESERRMFAESYNHAFRMARRMIVQQLALDAGSDQGDCYGNDEEACGDGVDGASANSLAILVTSQIDEIEMLRDRLGDSERSNKEQRRQLDHWKRQVVSNPTQIDVMLNELYEKNEELVLANKMFKEKTREKDDLIDELRRELSLCRSETIHQRDSIHDDVEGSHDIDGGPEEIGDETSILRSDEGVQSTGEGAVEAGSSRPQQKDCDGHFRVESESEAAKLRSLRTENSKLRKDVCGADKWMALAVQRMDEMGRENVELEALAASSSEELASLKKRLDQECLDLSVVARNIESNISALKAELPHEAVNNCSQEELVYGIRQQREGGGSAVASSTYFPKSPDLFKEIKRMKYVASTAQKWIADVVQHQLSLAQEMKSLEAKNKEVAVELDTVKSMLSREKESSAVQAKGAVTLENELYAVRAELEKFLLLSTEREAKLRGILENFWKDIGNAHIDQSPMEAELTVLRECSTAPERADYSLQVEKLCCVLVKLVRASRLHTIDSKSASESFDLANMRLQSDLDEARAMVEFLSQHYNEATQYDERSKAHDHWNRNCVTPNEFDLKEKTERIEVLENERAVKNELLASAQDDVAALRQEMTDLGHQSEEVISQWQDRATELEKAVENMEAKMQVQEEEAEEAISRWQERCLFLEAECISSKETEEEKRATGIETDSLRLELKASEDIVVHLRQKLEFIAERTATAMTDQLEGEISSLRLEVGRLETENGVLVENSRALEKERSHRLQMATEADRLRTVIGAEKSKMGDFEELVKEKDRRISSLQSELDHLSVAAGEGEEVIGQWQNRVEELENAAAERANELETQQTEADKAIARWQARVDELERNLSEVVSQLENQNADIDRTLTEWKIRCSHLESQYLSRGKSFEQKLSNANAEIEAMTLKLKDKDAVIEKTKDECAHLIHEVETAYKEERQKAEEDINVLSGTLSLAGKESEFVVSQWQERAGDLQLRVNQLESSMAEQQAEADIAIEQWGNRHNKIEEQLQALQAQSRDAQTLQSRVSELEEIEMKKQLALEQFGTCVLAAKIEAERYQKKLQDVIDENSIKGAEFEERQRESSIALVAKESEIEELKRNFGKEISLLKDNSMAQVDPVEGAILTTRDVCEKRRSDKTDQSDDRVGVLLEENSAMKDMADVLEASNCILTEQVEELQEELRVALHSFESLSLERAAETAVNALHMQVMRMRLPKPPVCDELATKSTEQHRRESANNGVPRCGKLYQDVIAEDFDKLITTNAEKEAGAMFTSAEQGESALADGVQEERIVERREHQTAGAVSASSFVRAFENEPEDRAATLDLAALEKVLCVVQQSGLTTKASLGDRISSLERNCGPLHQCSGKKVNILTAEIAELNTEKERLLKLLISNAENKNTDPSLALQVTMPERAGGIETKTTQVEQLCLEKAQLLDALSTIGQRMEQRLREIVSASASSCEVDIILEERKKWIM